MMTLIAAAIVAAQPTPAPAAHGQMAQMAPQQHEGMKEKCCCKDMAKHEGHESGMKSHDESGE